jgi:hypothetical protein
LERALEELEFLQELELRIRKLESKLGSGAVIRPFVCNGRLFACRGKVFIVGINPREKEVSFRDYWHDGEFNEREWKKEYLFRRYERGLDAILAGARSASTVSRTRAKLDQFRRLIAPHQVLETNIYSVATEWERELKPEEKDHSIFSLLFEQLKPRVVIAHGESAGECVCCLMGVDSTKVADGTAPFTKIPTPWRL